MDESLPLQLLVLLLLLLLSAFFSGSETAYFSLSRWRIAHLVRRRMPGARRLEKLRSRPGRLLVTILLGNNLVNIAGTSLLESGLEARLSRGALPISIGVMTAAILLFGEILPKSLAARRPERFATVASVPLTMVHRAMAPLRRLVMAVSDLVLRPLGVRGMQSQDRITVAKFRAALQQGREAGLVQEKEGQILERVFALKERRVQEIMVPRTQIVGLPVTASPAEALEAMVRSGHSRIPVFQEEGSEEVVGFLYAKDLLGVNGPEDAKDLSGLVRPPLFVPETIRAQDLLRELRERRLQIALAVDEHGGLAGLVTVEDALEVVVGAIFDETDPQERHFLVRRDGSVEILGRASVEAFQERFGEGLPPGQAQTVGGRVLEHLGRMPEEGQVIQLPGMWLQVTRVMGARISRLRMERPA